MPLAPAPRCAPSRACLTALRYTPTLVFRAHCKGCTTSMPKAPQPKTLATQPIALAWQRARAGGTSPSDVWMGGWRSTARNKRALARMYHGDRGAGNGARLEHILSPLPTTARSCCPADTRWRRQACGPHVPRAVGKFQRTPESAALVSTTAVCSRRLRSLCACSGRCCDAADVDGFCLGCASLICALVSVLFFSFVLDLRKNFEEHRGNGP